MYVDWRTSFSSTVSEISRQGIEDLPDLNISIPEVNVAPPSRFQEMVIGRRTSGSKSIFLAKDPDRLMFSWPIKVKRA